MAIGLLRPRVFGGLTLKCQEAHYGPQDVIHAISCDLLLYLVDSVKNDPIYT